MKRYWLPLLSVTVLCALACQALPVLGEQLSSATSDEKLFPFSLPAEGITEGVTDLSFLNAKPADDLVSVRDGHFYAGGKRIRFWTVVILSSSCFPPHDEAELVARRLANRGFNQVRLHLFDGHYAPNGIFDPAHQGELRILPSQLDKLDYFIAQLKKYGIYVELPVHGYHWRNISGAKGFPGVEREKFAPFASGVPLWNQKYIAAEQQLARELFGHVNPYTGKAYTEEPAVALMEIINENGILCAWRGNHLRKSWPESMIADLQSHWNRFLRSRYSTTDRLREAWAVGEVRPSRQPMLKNADFAGDAAPWGLQVVKPSTATIESISSGGPTGRSCLLLDSNRATSGRAFVLLFQTGLHIEKGVFYKLSFLAKADTPKGTTVRLGANVSMNHAPWTTVGLATAAEVGPEWQPVTFFFEGTHDESAAKLMFSPPTGASRVWLTGVSLEKADILGLSPDESLEAANVDMPLTPNDCVRRTPQLTVDFVDFLYELDHRYFTCMVDFLKNELGCRHPIKGTQVDEYSSYFSQSKCDFIDAHGYWQHPHFPRKPWDRNDWTIGNSPMVNARGQQVVSLAGRRVWGKPYNISEYSHPAPNTYCAEQIPTIASFGALQDWDGIAFHSWQEWYFDWHHREVRKYSLDRISSYFNMADHPVKLVTVPFGTLAFRRGDVAPAREKLAIGVTLDDEKRWFVDLPKRMQWWLSPRMAELKGATWLDAFTHQIGLELSSTRVTKFVDPESTRAVSDTGQLVYDLTNPTAGAITVNAPRAKAVIGFGAGKTFELGDVIIQPGPTIQNGFSVITASAVHGDDFHSPGARILVTATGYVENQGMVWNSERTSVGDQWGTGPVLCEGIPFQLTVKTSRATAWALDGRGRRVALVPGQTDSDSTRFAFGPRYKTLWYEVATE